MIAGALLLMLLGIMLPLAAATLLLAAMAFVFNWLLKRWTASAQPTPPAMPAPRQIPAPRAMPAPVRRSPATPATPAVTHSFAGVFTAGTIIAAALVVPYSFRGVQPPPAPKVGAVPNDNGGPDSIRSPILTADTTRQPPRPAAQPPIDLPANAATATATVSPGPGDEASTAVAALPNTPAERRRLLAEFAAQVGRLFGRDQTTSEPATTSSGPSGNAPVSLGESRNGEVVVLELTQPMVRQLLGDAAGDLLRDMQSRLPEDIREGYALIPLGSSFSSALPPVPPRLAASGLSSLADSLVSILSADSLSEPPPVAPTTPAASPRPTWIDDPPPRSRVVRITQVGNTSVELERTDRITQTARQLMLEQAAAENLSREYHTVIRSLPIDPQQYLSAPSWSETEEADLGSASGTQPVTTEFHLVSLPQDTILRFLPAVRRQVSLLRAIGVAACTATVWLGLLVMTVFSGRRVQKRQRAGTTADIPGNRLRLEG